MDRRLFEAAMTGNVESLLKLIEDDPCVHWAVALSGGETPLHIACLAGHLNFVQEFMKLSHGIAKELNQDGLSPLHIASARGHVEIVKYLLRVDPDLCLIKGSERRIPLHNAAIKGRVQVLKELLSANSDSMAEVTARGETALHLAVKNNQSEALRVLVEHLKQFNKKDILNSRDGQGNTILHLAVSRKQYEVIELMLNEHVAMGMAEVNPLNKRGLTPLDLLVLFQSEAGDREIEEILRGAGARRAEDMQSQSQVALLNQTQDDATNNSSSWETRTQQPQSRYEQLLEFFRYDEINDSPREVRNILLVIAILIATATYQAVLSPPGGVWQEENGPPTNFNGTGTAAQAPTAARAPTAGISIMGSQSRLLYGLFLLFNSLGFFTSLHMIYYLTLGFPMRFELRVSLFALVTTYDICMGAIAPAGPVAVFFLAISVVLPLLIEIASIMVRSHFKKPQGRLQGSHPQESA